MQLPCLIDLILTLILASNSKGLQWNISVPVRIQREPGSNITIPCTFTYPEKYHTEHVKVYWKKPGKSKCSENDKDNKAFVFHTDDTCVLDVYKGRTKLIGDVTRGDCSLQILNVRDNEPKLYVRVSGNRQNYSFYDKFVSISVNGVTAVTSNPDIRSFTDSTSLLFPTTEATNMATTEENPKNPKTMYAAIFVPVVALVIAFLVAGIFFYVKHKRSQSFTREESGYYANFSRASSNPPKREPSCTKQDKKLPELKAIDEPVYINVEAPTDQMHQSMDHTDHVYGNVDYSK